MTSRAFHRFAIIVALCTLVLVVAGGLVTSHGVGMAVPDWPNTYGYNMFFFPVSRWVGGVFYEHTHRLIASAVGVLTFVLAIWLQGKRARLPVRWFGSLLAASGCLVVLASPGRIQDGVVLLSAGLFAVTSSFWWPRCEPAPRWLRSLGLIAFFAVVLQGVLGGLRVVLLEDGIGIFHAALAQLFFVLICSIALLTSSWWREIEPGSRAGSDARTSARVRKWLILGTGLIFAQLVLGATMRHQHAGLAIPDFPLAYGRIWPPSDPESVALYNRQRMEVIAANPITAAQIHLQMAHRILALCILMTVVAAAWLSFRNLGGRHVLSRLSGLWAGLILLQVILGAATIWSNKAADVATGHVLVGTLSLALGAILCLISNRQSRLGRAQALLRSPLQPSRQLMPRPATAEGGTG